MNNIIFFAYIGKWKGKYAYLKAYWYSPGLLHIVRKTFDVLSSLFYQPLYVIF